jgi:Spy/CpxP family protein refolding chaperone
MYNQGRAFGMVAAVFAIGAASGGLAIHLYEATIDAPPAISIDYEEDSRLAIDEMSRQLNLDDSQRQRVQAILDECIMEEAELLMQVRSMQQAGRIRILEVLKPEQKAGFYSLFQQTSSE